LIIDAHSHGFHGRYLERIESAGGNWGKGLIAKIREMAIRKPVFLDIERRIEMLERNNIGFQVVTPGNWINSDCFPGSHVDRLNIARAVNDNLATLMDDSKGRLIPAGDIPVTSFQEGGLHEMERVVKALGFKALNLPSHINGKPLDMLEFEPFWAQAEEMGVVVYIHPTGPAGSSDRSYEAQYDLTHNFGWPFETALTLSRLVFSGIIDRYPDLKIVSHHLGGGLIPFFWGRIAETYDLSQQQRLLGKTFSRPIQEYFSRFYYDTAVGGFAPAIRCAYEALGAEKLVFATDFPHGPGTGEKRLETYPGVLRSLNLKESENKKIFEDNARRILNLI
jgi:aminocarboxymuconate-semialdehyde decarboxylase